MSAGRPDRDAVAAALARRLARGTLVPGTGGRARTVDDTEHRVLEALLRRSLCTPDPATVEVVLGDLAEEVGLDERGALSVLGSLSASRLVEELSIGPGGVVAITFPARPSPAGGRTT